MGPRTEVVFVPAEAEELNLGNMAVKPMPGTLHSLPWAADGKLRVGEVLCETFWIPPFRNGAHQEACPRYVARRQLDRLAKMGYKLYSGFEAEFIVCNNAGQPVFRGHDMFVNSAFSQFEYFVYSMDQKMAAAGVDVATLHTEYGDGQFEMALAPRYGIEAVDQLIILKQAVKEMSQQHNGWQATFMSKPFLDSAGNGLHFSHSLWSASSSSSSGADREDSPRNLFYDPQAENNLSTVARRWLAGLLRHGPALMALCSPTVNCYRRGGTQLTPQYIDWGIGYRSASVCAKIGHPSATYFENRLPGGAANPYLVMAATIAAGIDGIVNELECPPQMSINQRASAEKTKSTANDETAKLLPKSLSEALDALESDEIMCEALGKEFVHWFINSKRAHEVAKVAKAAESGQTELEIERELYFKLL
jgi:glutamine synthetase